jgi:hypothetical protein
MNSNIFKKTFITVSGVVLFLCLAVLTPPVRELIVQLTGQLIFRRNLNYEKWLPVLFYGVLYGASIIIILDFFILTKAGRKMVGAATGNKAEERPAAYKKYFTPFCIVSGGIVLLLAILRAAIIDITWDETTTYLTYVLPGLKEAFTVNQSLNNHILNSLLVRFFCFISGAQYNEFIIRLPNILGYIVYIYFAYLIARQSKYSFLVFTLFISNYYINEFAGLARGYGLATAFITAAIYFFEKWKKDTNDKKILHFFYGSCVLAALSNAVSLYIIFGMLVLIFFKYRKNILHPVYWIYYFIFLLALYQCVATTNRGPGAWIHSSHKIIDTAFSFSQWFVYPAAPTYILLTVFSAAIIYLLLKSKAKNDYCLILAMFFGVCLLAELVFYRGYPIQREVLPAYPLIVLILSETLTTIKNSVFIKIFFAVLCLALYTQFIEKINLHGTYTWGDGHEISIKTFSHAIGDLEHNKEFYEFMGNPDRGGSHSYTFYEEKLKSVLGK